MPDFSLSITCPEPLFFRDGRPATTNDAVFSTGLFPPAPSVLYGALRTAYMAQHPAVFPIRDTPADPTRQLILDGFLLRTAEDVLFPTPADLVRLNHSETILPLTLRAKSNGFISNFRSTHYLTLEQPGKLADNRHHLSEDNFVNYLHGTPPTESVTLKPAYLTETAKMGIARSLGVVREGALFRFDQTLMQGQAGRLSFQVSGSGLELLPKGRLELGSDGASGYYQATDPVRLLCPDIQVGELFKLIIVTPGLFAAGWYPGTLVEKEIITFIADKAYGIGGFDMKRNRPKTMYRAVPSGAVYFLRIEEANRLAQVKLLHGKSWSDYRPEQGFGIGYLAKALPTQHLSIPN